MLFCEIDPFFEKLCKSLSRLDQSPPWQYTSLAQIAACWGTPGVLAGLYERSVRHCFQDSTFTLLPFMIRARDPSDGSLKAEINVTEECISKKIARSKLVII